MAKNKKTLNQKPTKAAVPPEQIQIKKLLALTIKSKN